MIVEKRKKIRTKKGEHDWTAEFNFYEPGDWDDMPLYESEVIPWQIVLTFALSTGFAAYTVGCYFF